ncbi:hypothetical protein FE236_11205 [Mariprofundus erugo]|uniref:GTP-binding protein n=1 Tax=Mariprofundus erugo TaxID=2528639 RepID=A0A5R9GWM6_9PROT|nr:ATP/GTP-binding protein [Mariprofundus erugo]TLS69119.1 hypothetical protein FEF65_01115 [Mariprofundus erugo]TLS74775.1 hypothetical protein FE236_11205 [Mariprofundus erugo]
MARSEAPNESTLPKGIMLEKRVVKLVVAGPVNAGKSTLIRSVSDVPVLCTNEIACDDVAELKEYTTVAMDHGICYQQADAEIHLYGTPGQRRFDFMWEILAVGADGIVFLVDGSDPASIAEVSYIHDYFLRQSALPFVVGISRHDPASLSGNRAAIAGHLDIPAELVFACDPRSASESKALLHSLYERLVATA